MLYKVKITERSRRYVVIQAPSGAEAEEQAYELWNNGEIVIGDRDFDGMYAEWETEYDDSCDDPEIAEYEYFGYSNWLTPYLYTALEDDDSGEGGIAFQGETLIDFLMDSSIADSELGSLEDLNRILSANGIRPIAKDSAGAGA